MPEMTVGEVDLESLLSRVDQLLDRVRRLERDNAKLFHHFEWSDTGAVCRCGWHDDVEIPQGASVQHARHVDSVLRKLDEL